MGVQRKHESMFAPSEGSFHLKLSLPKSTLCVGSWQERIPPLTVENTHHRGSEQRDGENRA